jgi:beta-lactamase class A
VKRGGFIGTALAAAAAAVLPRGARGQELEQQISGLLAQGDGTFGVFARTMATGPALYAINAYERFPCASTIKVLVMTTAFYAEERTPGALAERVRFDRARLIGGSDYMQTLPDGERLRVGDLIRPMILYSDNTAANMLMSHFGMELINAVGVQAGMLDTHLARLFIDVPWKVHDLNVTTPYDMATLLYQIEYGAREAVPTIVQPRHCRRMVGLMLHQQDRDKIPAGLPPGTPVADKDGELDGTRNDAGIVEPFGDSPFILSIFTKGVGDYASCLHTIRRVARLTYDSVAGSDL